MDSAGGHVERRSRRQALRQLAAVSAAVAIPVIAVVVTARPIPNPPGREALAAISPARRELLAERQETSVVNKRAARKQRERDREARLKEQERRRNERRQRRGEGNDGQP